MKLLKQSVHFLAEHVFHRTLEGLGSGSYALIDCNRLDDAWYSHSAQLRGILKRFDIDLVIDVGANEGQYGASIRKYYDGAILSFEPVSSAFARLSEAASGDPNWFVQNVALGNENTKATIHVSKHSVFSSLLTTTDYCADHFGEASVGTTEEIVTVRRLDDVLDELAEVVKGRRAYLKLDTQGFDTQVFTGLGARLESVMAMQSELSLIAIYEGTTHWTDAVELYERSGFGVVGMFPVNRDGGRVVEFDCLLQRTSGFGVILPPS